MEENIYVTKKFFFGSSQCERSFPQCKFVQKLRCSSRNPQQKTSKIKGSFHPFISNALESETTRVNSNEIHLKKFK
jgi:hypothetical protein